VIVILNLHTTIIWQSLEYSIDRWLGCWQQKLFFRFDGQRPYVNEKKATRYATLNK